AEHVGDQVVARLQSDLGGGRALVVEHDVSQFVGQGVLAAGQQVRQHDHVPVRVEAALPAHAGAEVGVGDLDHAPALGGHGGDHLVEGGGVEVGGDRADRVDRRGDPAI